MESPSSQALLVDYRNIPRFLSDISIFLLNLMFSILVSSRNFPLCYCGSERDVLG